MKLKKDDCTLIGVNLLKMNIPDVEGTLLWTLILITIDSFVRTSYIMEIVFDSHEIEKNSAFVAKRNFKVLDYLNDEECEKLKKRSIVYLKRKRTIEPARPNRLDNIDLDTEEIKVLLELETDDLEKGMDLLRRKKVYRKFGL